MSPAGGSGCEFPAGGDPKARSRPAHPGVTPLSLRLGAGVDAGGGCVARGARAAAAAHRHRVRQLHGTGALE